MNVKNNILETIGNTPLVRLNRIVKNLPCEVYAKVEYFNPGNSTKDRMALKMVEVAEQEGKLKPGGTIIECTSGNTGPGPCACGVVKGYQCIFATTDKQSQAKVDILRALGAEVIVCPTNVEPKIPAAIILWPHASAKKLQTPFSLTSTTTWRTAWHIMKPPARSFGSRLVAA
jgi:cystathionine beta-synthase